MSASSQVLRLHVDQRPAWRQCEEQLAQLPTENPLLRASVKREVGAVLARVERWPHVYPKEALVALMAAAQAGDRAACARLARRSIRPAGRVRPGRVLVAAVLLAGGVAAAVFMGSVPAAIALGIVGLALLLIALPVGGLLIRAFAGAVTRPRLRRALARSLRLGNGLPDAVEAGSIYQGVRDDVRARNDVDELTGYLCGEAVAKLAVQAGTRGDASLLRLMYGDARTAIIENQVPPQAGYGLASVLVAAGNAEGLPEVSATVARHLLERLERLAPDAAGVDDLARQRLDTEAKQRARYLSSAQASREELYIEAREVAEVAPGVLVANGKTARQRYLDTLRGFVTQALEDGDGEALARLERDVEQVIARRWSWSRADPESDRALAAVVEALAGATQFPAVAAAASEARRALAAAVRAPKA